ncbi:MAG TPA: histidine kinase [Gallionellaceae bacterium]|nr:histidine kinase [Gallionellaceae bacterium]
MPKVQSINQILLPDALPNFRNLGATLRIILLVNGVVMLAVIAQAVSVRDIVQRFIDSSAFVQPVLLSSLLLLYILNDRLARLVYWKGVVAVTSLVVLVTLAIAYLGGDLYAPTFEDMSFHAWRNALLSSAITALLLVYFKLRALSLSTALHDARLQALQARIRPHFLFNSINAVLSIVRADPKRAETALEDMADLFRMAMADSQKMVLLRREIELSRQYLSLEKLRLGERLVESWQIDEALNDALIPPLILQPLLENAVYHGIEPLSEGGVIEVRLARVGSELHLDVRNPCRGQYGLHNGNKMALENIRERLALQFDVEAKYTVESGSDYYHVHIQLPYVKEEENE